MALPPDLLRRLSEGDLLPEDWVLLSSVVTDLASFTEAFGAVDPLNSLQVALADEFPELYQVYAQQEGLLDD